jgi:surfeit locus 1 family protein
MKTRSLVVLLAALAMALLTARLGLWQLDRAAQKRALHALIEQRAAQPPLEEDALAGTRETATHQHYRAVRLRGRWRADKTVFLDNRQMDGRPGFIVITPLALADGSAVVVQRGWVPRDASRRERLPAITSPGGEVEVLGRIAPPPSRLLEFGRTSPGPIRQNLDLTEYSAEIGMRLRPLSVQQLDTPGGSEAGLLRDWSLPIADVSMHLGYAFQWFALSALIVGLYVWFQLVSPRRRVAAP